MPPPAKVYSKHSFQAHRGWETRRRRCTPPPRNRPGHRARGRRLAHRGNNALRTQPSAWPDAQSPGAPADPHRSTGRRATVTGPPRRSPSTPKALDTPQSTADAPQATSHTVRFCGQTPRGHGLAGGAQARRVRRSRGRTGRHTRSPRPTRRRIPPNVTICGVGAGGIADTMPRTKLLPNVVECAGRPDGRSG